MSTGFVAVFRTCVVSKLLCYWLFCIAPFCWSWEDPPKPCLNCSGTVLPHSTFPETNCQYWSDPTNENNDFGLWSLPAFLTFPLVNYALTTESFFRLKVSSWVWCWFSLQRNPWNTWSSGCTRTWLNILQISPEYAYSCQHHAVRTLDSLLM